MDVEDENLTDSEMQVRAENQPPTHMSVAIHLFKLALLNSEAKYVLHSISYDPLPYASPTILDVFRWQESLLQRLDTWYGDIPKMQDRAELDHIAMACEIKYHEVKMLLLRPSPRMPHPSENSLRSCYDSATRCLRLSGRLYRASLLQYSWTTMHSVFLGMLTMLYCIWLIPQITEEIKTDDLISDIKVGSVVLSAIGEHWSEAKRSNEHLEQLSNATLRWMLDRNAKRATYAAPTNNVNQASVMVRSDERRGAGASAHIAGDGSGVAGILPPGSSRNATQQSMSQEPIGQQRNLSYVRTMQQSAPPTYRAEQMPYLEPEFLGSFLNDPTLLDHMGWEESIEVDDVFQGLFNGYAPSFDY